MRTLECRFRDGVARIRRKGCLIVVAQQKAAGAATPATAETNTKHAYSTADHADAKALATLRAELALRGYAVHDSSAGGFLVCRWGLTRHCSGVEELRVFLRLIGGQP
ncbi:MAG: hypothetical protein OJF60_003406 [Burkholderiaceae bacterium]|nr:MAG: hypothetical protein OJF60_003406 [Burkholderiaceae bacterium]